MTIYSTHKKKLILLNHKRKLLKLTWLSYKMFLMIKSREEMKTPNFSIQENKNAKRKFTITVNPEENSKN